MNERAPDFMQAVDGTAGAMFGWENAADLFDGPVHSLSVESLSVGSTLDDDVILFFGVETERGIQKLYPVSMDSDCARMLHAALGSILDSGDEEQ